jgi:hypothetical protein
MDTQTLFAHAAWFRLAVVGIDILAVVAIVRAWSAVAAWWGAPFPHRSLAVPARARGPGARLQRP